MVFRAGSLWTEYVLNIHRLGLDAHRYLPAPPVGSGYEKLWRPKPEAPGTEASTDPPKTIYQQKFEAYYGQAVGPDAPQRNPLTLKTLPPVLLIDHKAPPPASAPSLSPSPSPSPVPVAVTA